MSRKPARSIALPAAADETAEAGQHHGQPLPAGYPRAAARAGDPGPGQQVAGERGPTPPALAASQAQRTLPSVCSITP
ncbi:MAG TPA: hypothetical protein VGI96_39155 [Streptosporangiaceae bacterium]